MDYTSLLNLHLSQTEIFVEKSKNNSYSDLDKKNYQDNLNKLFSAVKGSISGLSAVAPVFEKQEHLSFICNSLEFLKDSILSSMPFEVVNCLNVAMNDWIDQQYIIVTSLNNNTLAFSYDPTLALEDFVYQSIDIQYGITFAKRLVQINLPLILSRDYFSSVVLYHELGHFIDLKYAISKIVAMEVQSISSSDFIQYEQFLVGGQNEIDILTDHLAEYFCDIFAAQYIGKSSNYYLQYLTRNSSNASYSHPSTINRVKVVNDFIDNIDNPIVKLIKKITFNRSGRHLIKRHEDIVSDEFYKFLPIEIDNTAKLHGVFAYAWEIWLKGPDDFKVNAGLTGDFTSDNAYKVLNNLVEKSIGNYFIEKSWEASLI
ncbi:hypothetical protein [uncultured Pedobacter sp.]|uniref:hypothetical protein n=1 Tax=uncultured Pedobacter sp. TaxID=246139 RepID=UPI0025FA9D00|nr:hypothetical protein [uncultured Pedobacter sp.]